MDVWFDTNRLKVKPGRLEEWEEVCGTLESINKLQGELHLTFVFRQVITIEFSSELFNTLSSLTDKKVALLCIGNNQYRIRKFSGVIAEA
jgi:hypothetical protein